MSNPAISTALQNLLNTISDPAGKAAITQTLLNSPSLFTMYNSMATRTGGAKSHTQESMQTAHHQWLYPKHVRL